MQVLKQELIRVLICVLIHVLIQEFIQVSIQVSVQVLIQVNIDTGIETMSLDTACSLSVALLSLLIDGVDKYCTLAAYSRSGKF